MAEIYAISNKPDFTSLLFENGKVVMTWREAAGAEKYIIKRSKKADCEYKKVAEVPFGTTSFEDESVSDEGLYWYRITAYRDMGDAKPLSKNSEAESINITTLFEPEPLSLRVGKGKSITFSWKGTSEADGYIVLRRHSFMKRPLKIGTTEKGVCSFTDTDYANGPLYFYSVQGFKKKGKELRYSHPSREISTASLQTTKITLAERKHFKRVRFTLRLTSGADGYILYSSDKERGEYKEVGKTEGLDSFILTHKGEKGQKGAFYKACAYKKNGKEEITGPLTKPLYIKYKL